MVTLTQSNYSTQACKEPGENPEKRKERKLTTVTKSLAVVVPSIIYRAVNRFKTIN